MKLERRVCVCVCVCVDHLWPTNRNVFGLFARCPMAIWNACVWWNCARAARANSIRIGVSIRTDTIIFHTCNMFHYTNSQDTEQIVESKMVGNVLITMGNCFAVQHGRRHVCSDCGRNSNDCVIGKMPYNTESYRWELDRSMHVLLLSPFRHSRARSTHFIWDRRTFSALQPRCLAWRCRIVFDAIMWNSRV